MRRSSALLCASGIGDGLLMMIVGHHLKKLGCNPTIFHESASMLAPLFKGHTFQKPPPLDELSAFDQVILENDNSKRAWDLFRLRDQGKMSHLRVVFPSRSSMMRKGDFLFDPKLPAATNLSTASAFLLGSPPSKENDLSLPDGEYRKFSKRIVIHPTSRDKKRNWKKAQFLLLAEWLKQRGFDLTFCMSQEEEKEWESIPFERRSFPSLTLLAHFIYESGYLIGNDSGLGHLASNLGIPTLTLSSSPKRIRVWRPDWTTGSVVTPLLSLPNFKGLHLRLREKYWTYFLPVKHVLKAFMKLHHDHESCCRLF